ncbi:NAD-dependent epimerase/dehydratase family protein [Methanocalculus taiwanensis]|uniref:NAD-dependent epimerase/dehydratase family protein n=1 Tax=Methanocalculus taiwanensis TaxID=106207 RepID=A0ABD4TLK6_9EURY|nr:GDP-mannose 4,6-dehydratase [Methanocalculus taiwanensis]MCQ1538185.1 NAD-dependent epimerase/dehydratase family protein [Methanocalculus taiwanensis]
MGGTLKWIYTWEFSPKEKGLIQINSDNSQKALVTGCAGFIGSTLTDRLLADGFEVIGIDRFSDYYARNLKEQNLAAAIQHPRFTLIEADIVEMDAFPAVDYVFHLAAQAGVRASWGRSFDIYTRDNIQTTQRLLDFYATHAAPAPDADSAPDAESTPPSSRLRRFVYSSSSSVYGDIELPMREDRMVQPVSPYGVSKLAAEHLCYLYWKNYGVPTVSLRYFTVYGPRQRPDMGINKFVRAILAGDSITIYDDGAQTRDFTYIDDAVEANVAAALCDTNESSVCGEAFNIGGGNRISVIDLIHVIEDATGKAAVLHHVEKQKGDVQDTWADAVKAKERFGWQANVRIEEGLARYVAWITERKMKVWKKGTSSND